jgi:broad specificity phosphatase PhoE
VAVLVTHGGTAGRLIEALLGLGPEHRRVFGPLGNCHWSELSFQTSGWRLMRHNQAAPTGPDRHVGASGDRGPFPGPSASDVPDPARHADPAPSAAGAPATDADASA